MVECRHVVATSARHGCGIGILWGVEEFVLGLYSYAVYAPHPPIPATHLVAWLAGWIWILPVNLTFFFLPFLFPDGEPVSPRWWPLAWAALGGMAISIAGATTSATALGLAGQIIELTCAVLATCTLVIRYRRARSEERQQIKWFAGASLLLAGLAVASTVVSFLVYHNGYVVFNPVGGIALPLGLAGLAAAIGISVLRYHLYDIGVFLRRALVYAALVVLIGFIYLVLVVAIGTRIAPQTTAADRAIPFVVAAILALIFQPVRSRLKLKLVAAQAMAATDPQQTQDMLQGLVTDVSNAVETLRELARGIYPAVLADLGLAAALEAQARRSPLTVEIRADSIHRYPPETEAAVYFCCLEALQNAVKHAQATAMAISVEESAGELRFSAVDNGRGIDVTRARSGSGIQNMVDRMAALDGSLDLGIAPDGGTAVTGRLPVPARHGTPA
jgi:two-component sensor histidine kinase